MYFWSGITTLAFLGVWGLPANAQIGENKDVERILTAAAEIQHKLFDKFQLDGVLTTNCLINGVKNRNIDILQLKRLADFVKTKTDITCNTLAHEWKYDFQDFFEPDQAPLDNKEKQILSTTCGKYPSAVWNAVHNGQTLLTKKIILGLLATVQPNITTPDAITLLENSVKIIENAQVDAFYVHENREVLLEISKELMTQNHLSPHENYQLTEMAAAQSRIQQITNFNIFSIIRPKTFPWDVINARDAIAKGIDDGHLEVCSEGGWSTPPDQLLGLVTSLTAVSNNHPLASSVHVLYPHVRMWYFCQYGYQYVPRTFNDIVFLLNSFLTIRNPTLLREVYLEFAKLPWQEYTTNLNYAQYCDPRSLMIDIVKSILNHPDGLKVCNTILFNYFINADDDCPHWLKPIFPTNSTHNPPLEVIIPMKEFRQPTTTMAPKIECNEEETEVIEPESLIALFDSEKHPVVAEILRENPYPVHAVSYNSREAAFKHIISDLIKTRTDYTKVKQGALRFAQRDILLNKNKILPVQLGCMRLGEKHRKNGDVTCEEDERKVVNPDSLIEIFDRMHYPLLEQFLRDHPFPSDSDDRYLNLHAIISKSMDDAHVSEELRAIFELFLGPDPPINQNKQLAGTWTCQPKCNLVSVVNQDLLIGIINERKITPIKNLVYWQPIFINDYPGLETREEILKKVLSDRRLKLKGDILPLVIAQAIKRLRISWKGALPPLIDEVCEHDLKYNDAFEPVQEETPPATCENVTIINQQSLMEIIGEDRINVLKNLVFMEPVMYEDYGQLQSREEVLKTILYDRMVQVNDEILNLVIPEALQRLQINWRGMLPPVTEEACTTDLIYDIVTPVPPIDDDIICEDTVPEAPNCGAEEEATLIAETNSLFDALEEAAPRATVIRQKVRASIYRMNDVSAHSKSYVLRDILLNLREEVENERLAYEVNQLLVSIHYGDRGMEPVITKYICLGKPQKCGTGEQLMEAIDVSSLWDALEDKTPIPLHILESFDTYLVPVQNLKSHRKSAVLREILRDLFEDTDDLASRERIEELMGKIRDDGPAREDALRVLKCIPDSAVKAPCDESSDEMDVGGSQIKSTVLPLDIENHELPGEILTTTSSPISEESSEECDDSDEVTTLYPTTSALESWEKFEDSAEVTTVQSIIESTTTTTVETVFELSEECEDSAEVTTPYQTTAVLLESWENFDNSGEVTAAQFIIDSTPTTTVTLLESSEECEDSEEVISPTLEAGALVESTEDCEEVEEIPNPTSTVEVTESSPECEESIEVTTEFIIPQEITTENDDECNESEEIPTTQATTIEAPTTPGLPEFGKLHTDEPLTECPCPEGTVFTQVLNNQDLVDLLPITETFLRYQMSQLLIPTNLASTPKGKILQAALKHLKHAERLPTNQTDMLSITALCAPHHYAELHPADALGCTDRNPWWLSQCSCKHDRTLIQTFLSHDIYNLLPHWEQELRHDISLMLFPVSQFTGRTRRQILEVVLQSLGLTSRLPHHSEGKDFPRVTAVCAQPGLYPYDELKCPAERKKAYCIYPMEIVDTKALLSAVLDARAFVEAKELLEIIEHSWIDTSNFGDFDTKTQVFEQILKNLHSESEAELQFSKKNHRELKTLLQQIEYVTARIRNNEEAAETLTICV